MLEIFLAIMLVIVFLAMVGVSAMWVFYILRFSLPLILRFLLFVLFGVSIIRAEKRETFNGTYKVLFLKWSDGNGKEYSTKDKGVKTGKMFYGFMGDKVYSDFDVIWSDGTVWNESENGMFMEASDVYCRAEGWFTVYASGILPNDNGTNRQFEIRMQKISNRILKRHFRCLCE